MSWSPCPDSLLHGDTVKDVLGREGGYPAPAHAGADNVEPDIVTSGGPPTLLPPYHQGGGGGGTSKKKAAIVL